MVSRFACCCVTGPPGDCLRVLPSRAIFCVEKNCTQADGPGQCEVVAVSNAVPASWARRGPISERPSHPGPVSSYGHARARYARP